MAGGDNEEARSHHQKVPKDDGRLTIDHRQRASIVNRPSSMAFIKEVLKMKKIIFSCFLSLLICVCALDARAQGVVVSKGPDPSVVADAEAEKEALHNLGV